MGSFSINYGSGSSNTLMSTYRRWVAWSKICTDAASLSNGFPAKYSKITACNVSANFYIKKNYAGDESARMYDGTGSNSSSSSLRFLNDKISTGKYVAKTVNLINYGKCKTSVTGIGTGLFNNTYQDLILEAYSATAQVGGNLKINDVIISCTWTAPKININTGVDSSSTGEGTVTPSSSLSIDYSGKTYSKTITATAKEGSTFIKWSDGITSATRTLSFTDRDLTSASTDKTYTAVFQKITYAITASAGAGGTISPSGSTQVGHGNSQTYTITPNDGYEIESVTVDGVNKGAISSFTFSNVTATHTISVTFKQIQTTPPEFTSASLIYSGAQVSAGNKVPAGESCILSVGVT